MPDHKEAPLDGYQFKEYTSTPFPMGQAQYIPSAEPIQLPGYTSIQGQPSFPYPPISYPMPPIQAAPRQKKMLLFPLTRHASPGKQVISMAIYSMLMLALFAGGIFSLILLSANQEPNNAFAHADGTANGGLILVFILFIFLVIPATALLTGALFGAARAFLATSIVTGGTAGLLLVYLLTQHIPITLNSSNSPATAILILVPITSTLVGFIYDRRRYAAWWKSFLAMLLGSAFLVTVLFTFVAILGRPADTSSLASFYVAIGCIWLVLVPLLALPIAGIEGIIHAILSARRAKTGGKP